MSSMTTQAMRRLPSPVAAHERGFGLVELMVAMTIALVILAALVALFIGTSRNNREMASANSLIDNGRFAIQLLESDLVHAGFWGTHVPRFDDQTWTPCRRTYRPRSRIRASPMTQRTGISPIRTA